MKRNAFKTNPRCEVPKNLALYTPEGDKAFNPSVAHGWFCCTFAQRVTAQTKASSRAAETLAPSKEKEEKPFVPTDLAVILLLMRCSNVAHPPQGPKSLARLQN